MRIAEICPNCSTYINAACVVYTGDVLSNLDIAPLTTLDDILAAINDIIPAISGSGAPSPIPAFVGQLYIDTSNSDLWIGLSNSSANWGLVGDISTTTTTTTSA